MNHQAPAPAGRDVDIKVDAAQLADRWLAVRRLEEDTKREHDRLTHKLMREQLQADAEARLTPAERAESESKRFYSQLNDDLLAWRDIRCSWWQPDSWRLPIEQRVLTALLRRECGVASGGFTAVATTTTCDAHDEMQHVFATYQKQQGLTPFQDVIRRMVVRETSVAAPVVRSKL